MLARRSTRLLTRSSVLAQRTISTTNPRSAVYVLPVDPKAPSAPNATNVDASALWSSTPAASTSKPSKAGTTRIFYDTPRGTGSKDVTALTSLGDKWATKTGDERRETVRKAVGSAVKTVKALGEDVDGETVLVDGSADPHAAGTSTATTSGSHNDFVTPGRCTSSRRVSSRLVRLHAQDKPTLTVRPSYDRGNTRETRATLPQGERCEGVGGGRRVCARPEPCENGTKHS